MAAELSENFVPRVLGSMALRPGWKYLGNTASNNQAVYIPFVFSTSDTALVELTNDLMRVWVSDTLVTRTSVSTAITNGNMTAHVVFVLSNWTDASEAGCAIAYLPPGGMQLGANGTNNAIGYQLVTVAAGDVGKEHALRITIGGYPTAGYIYNGPVKLRVGSTLHGDEYINETSLGEGVHSLAFTPTGNFYVEFKSNSQHLVTVLNCNIEAAGVMTIPTSYTTANLPYIRHDESADVIFLACSGARPMKIERRATHSWSFVYYKPETGPFQTQNVTPITLTANAITGDIVLTASKNLFYSNMIGQLVSHSSVGQVVTKTAGALNDVTPAIRVTGIGATRNFSITITSLTASGDTVKLQYSFDNVTWYDVAGKSWTTDQATTYTDGLDNQIVYYQLICSVYVAATAPVMGMSIATGTIRGIAEITQYNSATSVNAKVLSPLGGTNATDTWQLGSWSDRRGWPTAVKLHDGRLWWLGQGTIIGSQSDIYDGFDETDIGDGGPINRSIGSGPVDTINWGLSSFELTVGAQGAEISVRSDSLGSPLTPTNFNIKTVSTQGSAAVSPVKVDQTGMFVQRSGIKIYQLSAYNPYMPAAAPIDLTTICPEYGSPGIVKLVVQRQPDTRLHAIRSDGTVMMGVFDPNEQVLCWVNIITDGVIEDAVILPSQSGVIEDQVYYSVKRTINGATSRMLEKWALETECRGGTLNKQADSFTIYSGAATTTITGLSYLEGKQVCVWADGKDYSPGATGSQTLYTVTGGQITLGTAVSNAIIGLPYTGKWQSAKLGLTVNGTVLSAKKNMSALGLVCAYFHPKGLQYGNTFDSMFDMPAIEQGIAINPDTVRTEYDEQPFFLDGGWTTDLRLCLQAQAPRPVTLMGAMCDSEVSP
jgi:hypothetical protein